MYSCGVVYREGDLVRNTALSFATIRLCDTIHIYSSTILHKQRRMRRSHNIVRRIWAHYLQTSTRTASDASRVFASCAPVFIVQGGDSMNATLTADSEKEQSRRRYEELSGIIRSYDRSERNLIQVLHGAQRLFGCVPPEVQCFVARELDMPLARVTGVVSFYSFFTTVPNGRHTISICMGTACYVRGGKTIVSHLKEKLGIGPGETTPDGRFTLEIKRCIGACGLAPAVSIDGTVYRRVSQNQLDGILAVYE